MAVLVDSLLEVSGHALEPAQLEALDVAAECARVEALVAQERLVDAFVAVDTLDRSLAAHQDALGERLEHVMGVLGAYDALLARVRRDWASLHHLCAEFFCERGWTLAKHHKGFRTHYRYEDGEPTVSVKVCGRIDAPILNVVALIYETDLWRSWYDRLTHSDAVHELGRFAKSVYFRCTVPGPIAARDGYMLGQGFDLLASHGAVVILARDASAAELGRDEVPPAAAGDVRLRLVTASCVLIPRGPHATEVCIVGNADPKVAGAGALHLVI